MSLLFEGESDMGAAEYEGRFTEPGLRAHVIKFVGGTETVTKVFGRGMTATWISTGIVEIAWPDYPFIPGTFIGLAGRPAFEATTQGDVKAFEAIGGVYNATTHKLLIHLFESGTLADLAALEWCTATLLFSEATDPV
jgi:hypothetical protein